MPKIAMILEATTGGTARHVCELACLMHGSSINNELVDISLIYSNKRDKHFDQYLCKMGLKGIELIRIDMYRDISIFRDTLSFLSLYKILRKKKWDIIHTHSSKAGVLGRLCAFVTGKKAVHTPHVFPFEMKQVVLKKVAYKFTEKLLSYITAQFIAVSESEYNTAKSQLGIKDKKISLIKNIVSKKFCVDNKNFELRRKWGIKDEDIFIGFFGRLEEQKNPMLILRSAEIIINILPNINFLLVGSGSQGANIKRYITKNNLLKHFILIEQQPDLDRYWRCIDALIMPSLWESMPYTLLDAINNGVSVIASDIPSILEIKKDCRGIKTFRSDNRRDCADVILKFASHKDISSRKAEFKDNGQVYFSEDIFKRLHINIYQSLLN